MARRVALKVTSAPRPARWDKEGEDKATDNGIVAEKRGAHGGGLTRGKRVRRGGGQEVHVTLFIRKCRGQNG
jgi:hypothetical protein